VGPNSADGLDVLDRDLAGLPVIDKIFGRNLLQTVPQW
jgi:hypothetical protein